MSVFDDRRGSRAGNSTMPRMASSTACCLCRASFRLARHAIFRLYTYLSASQFLTPPALYYVPYGAKCRTRQDTIFVAYIGGSRGHDDVLGTSVSSLHREERKGGRGRRGDMEINA